MLRNRCRDGESPFDAAMLQDALRCPPDSVRVGPSCIDIYEASVWMIPGGETGLLQKVRFGTVSLVDLDKAGLKPVVPSLEPSFVPTGNGNFEFYAVSVRDTQPTSGVTWFQAEQACALSGKHLITNQEWQRAAAGTPDGSPCIVTGEIKKTGTPGCDSNWGTYDMVGNVWEWVADWGDLNIGFGLFCTKWPAEYGSDESCVGGPGGADTLSFPSAFIRGGGHDSGSDAGVFAIRADNKPNVADRHIGFRCAR